MRGLTPIAMTCALTLTPTGFAPTATAASATGSIPVGRPAA